LVGQQFAEPGVRMAAEACEALAQLSERVDAKSLRGRDETAQHGRGPSSVIAAQKHPILSTHRDSGEATLSTVVVNHQIAAPTV
jgi:hypothetical protein